jgi:predicted Ser/Thr protein kinase
MDKIIRNYEEPLSKNPTTRDFLKYLKHKRNIKKKQKEAINNQIDCGHDHSNEYKNNVICCCCR